MNLSRLAKELKPYVAPWIADAVGGVAVAAPSAGGGGGGVSGGSYTAGDGIDIVQSVISVDVTDFLDTDYGLMESANNAQIKLASPSGMGFSGSGGLQINDAIAGAGLTISNKILAVGTPSTLAAGGANSVDGTTHSHAVTSSYDGYTYNNRLLQTGASGQIRLDYLRTPRVTDVSGAASLELDPAVNLILDPGQDVTFGEDVGFVSDNFLSGFLGSGWSIQELTPGAWDSHLDIRSIYAEELHVTAFIADTMRIRVGEDFLAESAGFVAGREDTDGTNGFTVPALGSTTTVWMENVPDLPGQIFAVGDYVMIRFMNREQVTDAWATATSYAISQRVVHGGTPYICSQDHTSGASTEPGTGGSWTDYWQELTSDTSLIVATVWVEVMSYNEQSGYPNAHSYVVKTMHGPSGLEAKPGSYLIDFGNKATGGSWIHHSAIDAYAPWTRYRSWTTNPWTPSNRTIDTAVGNLGGISDPDFGGALSGYGFYATNAYLKGALTAGDTVIDSAGMRLHTDSAASAPDKDAIIWKRSTDNVEYAKLEAYWNSGLEAMASLFVRPNAGQDSKIYVGTQAGGTDQSWIGIYADNTTYSTQSPSIQLTSDPADNGLIELDSQVIDVTLSTGGEMVLGGAAGVLFRPSITDTYDWGTPTHRWDNLYVKNIVADTITGGTALGGQTWQYDSGHMYVKSNAASAVRWLYLVNEAALGQMGLNVDGDIVLSGNVDGVDVSALSGAFAGHAGDPDAHHDPVTVGNGLTLATQLLGIDADDGIQVGASGIGVKGHHGISVTADGVAVSLNATASGLDLDANGLAIADSLAGGGLIIASKALAVGAGVGIDVAADSVSVDVTDIHDPLFGLGEDANKLKIVLPAHSGLEFVGGLRLGMPGTLTAVTTNALVGMSHEHAVTATADGAANHDTLLMSGPSGELALDALTVTNVTAVGDLTIDPTGLILFPNAQELKSSAFTDLSTGISGWRWWQRGGDSMSQLTIGAIKVDELYARAFVADEVRLDRGEEYWSKSYGEVDAAFDLPGLEALVHVTFKDSPGLGGANLFSGGDWLLARVIDWDTSLSVIKIWFTALDKIATGGSGSETTQTWRIRRKSGGTTGLTIPKGIVLGDFGVAGQGFIHLSALKQDGGPFIQFGDWHTDPSNPANWNLYARMGNLNGTASIAADKWGLVAGKNIGAAVGAGFEGIVASEDGAQLYNTDISLYNGGTQTVSIDANGNVKVGSNIARPTFEHVAATGLVRLGLAAGANATFNGSALAIEDASLDVGNYFKVYGDGANAGDVLMGSNVGVIGSRAFHFDASAGDIYIGDRNNGYMQWNKTAEQLQFRDASTVHAYVDASGKIKAGGGAVVLGKDGLALEYDDTPPSGDKNSIVWYSDPASLSLPAAKISHYVSSVVSRMEVNAWHSMYGSIVKLIAGNAGSADEASVSINGGFGPGLIRFRVDGDTALVVDSNKLEVSGSLTLPYDKPLIFKNSSGAFHEMMRYNGNLFIGDDVSSGNQTIFRNNNTTILRIYNTNIWAERPFVMAGNTAITGNPITAGNNGGWKASLYSNTYAIGVASGTFAIKSNNWFSVFSGVNPANDGGPDSNAAFSVNSDYINHRGALGEAWKDLSLASGWSKFSGLGWYDEGIRYKKFSDMIYVHGMVKMTGTSATSHLIATLPSGYRPTYQVMHPQLRNDGSGTGTSRINVNTSGQIQMIESAGSAKASTWLALNFSFSIAS